MSDRIDGGGPAATVTSISRGRDVFTAAAADTGGAPLEIPIGLIDPSPANPRSSLGDLEGLAASIRELGVLQPISVRPNGNRYDLIYGHRRLAAAQLAKRKTVPAFLSLDGDELLDHTRRLVENLHREDLSPLDEARAYQQLQALVPGGQRALARMVGKSQTYVSKRLGLLRLPDEVQVKVGMTGGITLGDAFELGRLVDAPERLKEAIELGTKGYRGGIGGAARQELEELESERARQARRDDLRANGVAVIEGQPSYNRINGPYPLISLGIAPEDHAGLDCHAAHVPRHGTEVVFLCVSPQVHLGAEKNTQDEERARQAEARAERHAARLVAARARHEFGCGLVRKGSPDAGGGVLMVQLLLGGGYLRFDSERVAELLGIRPDTYNGRGPVEAVAAFTTTGPRNTQRAVYAAGLVMGETAITNLSYDAAAARKAYLDHLVAAGYELSAVEIELLAEDAVDEDEDPEDEGFGEEIDGTDSLTDALQAPDQT